MKTIATRTRTLRCLALGISGAVLLAGCGAVIDKSGSGSGSAGDNKAPLFAKLPKDVRDRGSLRVVTGDYKVPMDYRNSNGKLVGVNIDLANELSKLLGVKIDLVVGTFDSVLGGIQSGRYDTAIYTMNDTAERQQLVNLVDYANVPSGVVVPKGNPKRVSGVDGSLCGLRVTAKYGQVEATEIRAQSKKCVAAGKKAIELQLLQDDGSMQQAVLTGRVDAEVSGAESLGYVVKKNPGKVVMVPAHLGQQPVGMPFRKDRAALAKVVAEAWRTMLANGTYERIAKKWGVEALVPEKIQVNLGKGL
jgi:polar amino acid transport system substrate-binding protein